MKKTITIITLALLMVASLFAMTVYPDSANAATVSTNNTTQTTVELTLKKTPTYIFGIKDGEFTSSNITTANVPSTEIENTTEIELERYVSTDTGKNILDVKPVSSYYLSYLFYEYDAVTFTMTLSGNLTTGTDKDATDNSDDNQIPYTVKVAAGNEKDQDNGTTGTNSYSEVTLDSSDSSKRSWTTGTYTATDKLGQYRWASLQLTIAPKYSTENTTTNTDPTLKGKVAGTYKSTITLTVTVA